MQPQHKYLNLNVFGHIHLELHICNYKSATIQLHLPICNYISLIGRYRLSIAYLQIAITKDEDNDDLTHV